MNSSSYTRPVEEHHFTTHDNTQLFYRYWPAVSDTPRGAIVLFHRGHEHSGRLTHIVNEINMNDYAFFAWDARGHGLSPGTRGYSPSLGTSVRDVQSFIQHICSQHAFEEDQLAVIAQSVGAVLVSTWVHDYAPRIRCMVLASPAFKVKLYVPFARTGIRLLQTVKGEFFVNSYVKARFLTHDPERIASYENDPLITRPIASHILLSLYQASDRVIKDAAAITVPAQLLISGSDKVVHHAPQHRFYENLGSTIKERHILSGFYHDTLGEKDRHIALEKARDFIEQRFKEETRRNDLIHADLNGHTKKEADELASPVSRCTPRGMYWSMSRGALKAAGLLSSGIRLGHKTGFDSGSTLDYVYENRARGITGIGRAIDRAYLNAIGWRGIRQRKTHIEEMIAIASDKLRQQYQPVHIMDIASGHGRYILDSIKQSQATIDSILLRDYSELNVTQGRQLIREKGFEDIASFTRADAFDPVSYLAHEQSTTLGVVSGLYELFADNAPVMISLQGLAQSIQTGGYLVYTGQPWHPQLETIARTLTSHRGGQAWVMRRRSQQEMDQLVENAGFTKIDQRIDEDGIFTVSLARRN